MKLGQRLIDMERGETPYRVDELLGIGANHQVASGYDEERDKSVAVRALLYEEDDGAEAIARRREGLRRQWSFLEDLKGSDVIPEPLDWLEVQESPVDEPPEPLLVCERVDGTSLYDWIVNEHPSGLNPRQALAMAAQLTDWLIEVHHHDWLWRDFDPRRFAVDDDGCLQVRSLSGVVRRGARLGEDQLDINADYVAPEVRDEMTGKMQRPSADLYGLGALLSFMLTAEEPRERVECPLSYPAYERLGELEIPGLELLIARLLQPLAKKRLGRADKLRPYLDLEALPTRQQRGFEMCMLPAPWLGLDLDDPSSNRGLRSRLSAGPLVSMARDEAGEEATVTAATTADEHRALNWPAVAAVVLFVVVMLVWVILSGGH